MTAMTGLEQNVSLIRLPASCHQTTCPVLPSKATNRVALSANSPQFELTSGTMTSPLSKIGAGMRPP